MAPAFACLCACANAPAAAQTAAPGAPVALGIHHLKFVVADLEKSRAFYEAAFGTKTAMDHRKPDGTLFAYILSFPGLGTELEIRLDPAAAKSQKGLDPITLTVDGPADLEKWRAHFQAKNLPHSPVLAGLVGWLIVVEDPDGRRLRLYTKQTHGPEVKPSWDSPWIN
ncbi:MAG TPA: VOC family protein [Ramlibacter sp.]|uniref:VOC family protein n=1 Tax=Ramlibacter sp. TaxID=1917967 RepID=UPI002C103865|nr:VOC family protein [Ramlibacter sp.]HVZ45731.1 VOC family protein [Ramlibacter sp.]